MAGKKPNILIIWGGPRGVLHSFANPDGTQKIEDTGPLDRKRMETVDFSINQALETRPSVH